MNNNGSTYVYKSPLLTYFSLLNVSTLCKEPLLSSIYCNIIEMTINKDKVANIDLFVDIINLHCKPFLNGRMAFNA